VTSGGSAPQGRSYFGGPLRFVRVQHLDVGRDSVERWDSITQSAVDDYHLELFPPGTILLPKSGASIRLEKRAMLGWPSYVVSHLAAVIPGSQADGEFLFHWLRRVRFGADKKTGYPTLRISELRDTQVMLPPLLEQRRIARALGTVATSRRAQCHALDAYEKLEESLGGSLSDDPGHRWASDWQTVTLRDVVAAGPQNGFYRHFSFYGRGTGIVRITDYPNEGGIVTSAENRVELTQSELATFQLSPGDILLNRVNSIPFVGKTALIGDSKEPLVFESTDAGRNSLTLFEGNPPPS
jgi:type I restriction enzyme, S subunit